MRGPASRLIEAPKPGLPMVPCVLRHAALDCADTWSAQGGKAALHWRRPCFMLALLYAGKLDICGQEAPARSHKGVVIAPCVL